MIIFIGTAIFHAWRGSLEDILIFGGAAALIVSQVLGFTRVGFTRQPTINPYVITVVVIAAALVLYFSPRQSLTSLVTLLLFIPIGILLLLYVDQEHQPMPDTKTVRTRLIWGTWALVFGGIELVAYLSSKLTDDLERYPTISVLLDPALDDSLGRAVFVALWLTSGVYLFGVRRRK